MQDMKTVLFISKDDDAFAVETQMFVEALGIEVVTDPTKADFTIILGGDGTVLGAARAGVSSPVLVINTGHLGFLSSSDKDHAVATIDRLIAGKFTTTERHLLKVCTDDKPDDTYLALNDVVIRPRASSDRNLNKLIHLSLYATEEGSTKEYLVADYRADGLIVATPTGSTAYSLSASGPIIHPMCRAFVVTPICPQALTQRPLVLPHNTQLRIVPHDSDLYVSIDSQVGRAIEKNISLRVGYNAHSIHTVNPRMPFYDILQQKLGWGIRPVK